jgi:hypothetical protein
MSGGWGVFIGLEAMLPAKYCISIATKLRLALVIRRTRCKSVTELGKKLSSNLKMLLTLAWMQAREEADLG